MKLSPALKGLLKEKFGLKDEATDEEAKALLNEKFASGELTAQDMVNAESAATDKVKSLISEEVSKATAPLTEALAKLTELVGKSAAKPEGEKQPEGEKKPEGEKNADEDFEAKLDALLKQRGLVGEGDSEVTPAKVFLSNGNIHKSWAPRVKAAVETYSAERKSLDVSGIGLAKAASLRDAIGPGGYSTPSDKDYAMIGAWFKHKLAGMVKRGLPLNGFQFTEHDEQLYAHLLHEEKWCGTTGGKDGPEFIRKLTDMERKDLLNDPGSGGQETVPLVYDNAVIQTSILEGELWPFVNVTNINRGNQVHAYSMGRPTLTANVNEGTAISLLDTSAFFAALDTKMYTAVGAMTMGRDWQEDSPVNLGMLIVKEYGEAARNYLDKIVAVGDGTTQATGIFTASSTVKVPSAMGSNGNLTVGDFQNLEFGLTKAERARKPSYFCYVGNDTKYKNALSIPVGPDDQRRMFGQAGPNMEVGSGTNRYVINGYPFKVCGDCSDSQLAFANLKRYRAYRRLGATFAFESSGQTLILKNEVLIVMRMRIGGQPELGAAFAVMTDTPVA